MSLQILYYMVDGLVVILVEMVSVLVLDQKQCFMVCQGSRGNQFHE